ncbi:MAG: hypothetical protein KJT01_16465 [Gemmatimonadetes bacterium]|nr:hypothetical protein [Gemmatimonadota bacterium]
MSTLMAVVLLAIGITALAGASSKTVTLQAMAQNRTHAIAIAQSHLEALRMRDPWTVASEGAVAVGGDGIPAGTGLFRRRVIVEEVRSNLLSVTVQVRFPGGAVPVVLTTKLFRGSPPR